ncbi:sensor histidine kinase [Methylobacterium sp. Leaf466]|uniref:sensor histidine kinase n=1 Tax=Methylobacterium sp. Leaf466 TaxID=1736386 RepID=UPI0006FAD80A|nr:sensor histidine kinase [Methylobacterium sp. Leaf466]KQT89027.1 hypothetical protein ASG59_14300 [Methylobacterium sp. Leaf466]
MRLERRPIGPGDGSAAIAGFRGTATGARARLPTPSLRLVLALVLGVLGLASTLVLTALVTREASARLQVEIAAQLKELAGHMARTLDEGMFERQRDIEVVAANGSLRDPEAPLAARRTMLQVLQRTYPLYSIVGLIDPEGRVLATSRGILEGADVSRRDYFLRGREGVFIGDVHDAALLRKALSRPADEPLRLVDIAAPVHGPDGGLVGVVAAHLDWTWAREVAASFTRSLTGRRAGAQILVVSRDGTVLIGPPSLEGKAPGPAVAALLASAKEHDGSVVTDWQDGGTYVTAVVETKGFRGYRGLGWSVVARHEVDRALASVTDLRRMLLIFGSLVALAGAGLAWLVAGRVARPLSDLAGAAAALGRDEPLPALSPPLVREGRAVADALVRASAELRRREVARRLLVDELNHRVKNTLATVQSLARQSLRAATGEAAQEGRATFEARLFALASAHDVLTRESWASVDLADVVAAVIRPYRGGPAPRFALTGPEVRLSPRTALALSMAIHELCTNAAKYGALSTETGTVGIAWRVEPGGEGQELHLTWREEGGPPVSLPDRRGFGSRLIERGLAAELRGATEIRFEPTGVVCALSATLTPA